jgi:uncharacterized protein YcsI (UPF0317 family)
LRQVPDDEVERLRAEIRSGSFRRTTSGACPGRVQANLVVLPESLASDFRRFCQRNPKPCPLLEETAPGAFSPSASAPSADLRTDVPRYRVYRNGELDAEVTDVVGLWRDDLVSFLLGCSFTFERALTQAGIPLRHQEEGKVVPMYRTLVPTRAAGRFRGPLVVSMRPVPRELVERARSISSRYPRAHGDPVHAGDPGLLGIEDLSRPDFGEAVEVREGEVPLFWACGVTPQAAARFAKPELLITQAPGHMFVSDLTE